MSNTCKGIIESHKKYFNLPGLHLRKVYACMKFPFEFFFSSFNKISNDERTENHVLNQGSIETMFEITII